MTPIDRLTLVYESPSTVGLSGPRKAILAYVAFRDGGSGCTVSMARMVAETGFSERTLQRELRVLAAAKMLEAHPAPGLPTAYRLTPAALAPPPVRRGAAETGVPVAPKQEENRNGMNRKRTSSPPTPQGGEDEWEQDPLFERWADVVRAASENPSIHIEGIVRRTRRRLTELREVEGVLRAKGASWEDLAAGAEGYDQAGHLTPLEASLTRIRANDGEKVKRLLLAAANGHAPIKLTCDPEDYPCR